VPERFVTVGKQPARRAALSSPVVLRADRLGRGQPASGRGFDQIPTDPATYTTGAAVYSSPAVVGGTVYIGSWDRTVYALKAGS
jgi:outer membrane protein assembly factor BamB